MCSFPGFIQQNYTSRVWKHTLVSVARLGKRNRDRFLTRSREIVWSPVTVLGRAHHGLKNPKGIFLLRTFLPKLAQHLLQTALDKTAIEVATPIDQRCATHRRIQFHNAFSHQTRNSLAVYVVDVLEDILPATQKRRMVHVENQAAVPKRIQFTQTSRAEHRNERALYVFTPQDQTLFYHTPLYLLRGRRACVAHIHKPMTPASTPAARTTP